MRRAAGGSGGGQALAVFGLLALCIATAIVVLTWPSPMAYALLVPIIVAAGLFLRSLSMYLVFAVVGLAVALSAQNAAALPLQVAVVVVMVLLMAVDHRRERTGIPQQVGASMLVDLRERLREQGRLPSDLPEGWHAEGSIQAAHGDAFSGDFLVTNRSTSDVLELVLVDVSGKGMATGTRSLMLSGAFAGLLGATEPAQFLPSANRYLLRQNWAEGFATAVHVALDLRTGEFSIGSAGHPAAVHYRAGCGRWEPTDAAQGVVLGILGDDLATFTRQTGRLDRGDALLLYTDGVIESRGADLAQGMDRMLGAADRVVAGHLPGGTDLICAAARAGETDDRAAVLIWRD